MDLTLAAGDVEVLEARTEGWIAALQLAALSMQGRDDVAALHRRRSPATTASSSTTSPTRCSTARPARSGDFLLETSILEPAHRAAVRRGDRQRPDGKATLETLDRANLFLVPLDDRRTWYRYHHLFADVLRARLLDEQPDRVAELHRRASDWYAANGEPARGDRPRHGRRRRRPSGGARSSWRPRRCAGPARRRRCGAGSRPSPTTCSPTGRCSRSRWSGARMSTGDIDRRRAARSQSVEVVGVDRSPRRRRTPIVFDDDEYARLPAQVAVHRAGARAARRRHRRDHRATPTGPSSSDRATRSAPPRQRRRPAGAGPLDRAATSTPPRGRYTEAVACFVAADYLPDVLGCSLALADIQIAQGRLARRDAHVRVGAAAAPHHGVVRGAADMHVGLSGCCSSATTSTPRRGTSRPAPSSASTRASPSTPTAGGSRMARLPAGPRRPRRAPSSCSTEAEARYNTDFSPPVRPVAAIEARVQVAQGDVAAGARAGRRHGPDRRRRAQLRPRVRAHHPRPGAPRPRRPRSHTAATTRSAAATASSPPPTEADGRGAASRSSCCWRPPTTPAATPQPPRPRSSRRSPRAEPEGYVRVFLDAGPAIVAPAALAGTPRGPPAARPAGPRRRDPRRRPGSRHARPASSTS